MSSTAPEGGRRKHEDTVMIRRALLKSIGFGGALSFLQVAKTEARSDRKKVAYHLSDFEKVGFVLGNIANHLNGAKGSESPSIILVVHGPALPAFAVHSIDDRNAERMAQLLEAGVAFEACDNTL